MITRDSVLQLFSAAEIQVADFDLNDDRPLKEQGVDSLDMANLLFQIEQAYQFTISTTDASSLHTMRDIVDYIGARIAA